jgi:hypothetical protein
MQQVVVRLKGHLDLTWANWLDGFTLTHSEQGESILSGKIKDQTALFGLIAKLRDLGVTIVAVSFGDAASKE